MRLPEVIVVTRTKNRLFLLQRAINSIRLQTFENYYHVIVNDGGNAEALDNLLLDIDDKRIVVIHNSSSLGMESASNIGLKYMKAKYAVIHDDDDTWQPDFLMECVNYLNSNAHVVGVVSNIMQCFESTENNNVRAVGQRLYNPAVKTFLRDDFLVTNQFVPIAFLYRYDLHLTVGFYNEALSVCGDLEFFLRILSEHQIGKISKCLANYHIRVDSHHYDYQNSVSDTVKHLNHSTDVLARLDDRNAPRKLKSWLRVKIYYRFCNILLRLLNRLGYFK